MRDLIAMYSEPSYHEQSSNINENSSEEKRRGKHCLVYNHTISPLPNGAKLALLIISFACCGSRGRAMGPTPSTSSPGRTKLSTCIESEHRHKLCHSLSCLSYSLILYSP